MKKLIIVPFFLFSLIVKGTDYYVKNSGNDSNSGLSDAQAWAHHPWMSTWTGIPNILQPGDKVYMKKGSKWTIASPGAAYMTVGQSGTEGNPIITSAYGTGNSPIINISTASDHPVIYANGKSFVTFDNLHITHHSSTYYSSGDYINSRSGIMLYGTTNPCHDITITNCEINNIPWEAIIGYLNCYNITVGDINAKSTATSTTYSNNIHDYGYAGIMLLGSNPADDQSNFKVYYNYVHDANRVSGGVDEYGIQFSALTGSHGWPINATARYNRVENIKVSVPLGIHGGSYIYFQDNYVKCFGMSGINLQCNSSATIGTLLDHIYVERNTIEQVPNGWIPGNEAFFIGGMMNGSPTANPTEIYITDNTCFYTTRPATNIFSGIRQEVANGLIISGNKFYNGATNSGFAAIYFGTTRSYGIRNATITGNFIINWGGLGFTCTGDHITGPLTITNNIIVDKTRNIQFTEANIPATNPIKIYNNTLIGASGSNTGNIYIYGLASGGSIDIKNNIIGKTVSEDSYYFLITNIAGTLMIDNNLYWNSSSGRPFYQGGLAWDWISWTRTLGHDTHGAGPNTNPRFINSGRSYSKDLDFALQSTSPAINKGANVGLSTDYTGNPISGIPDIGAYEYQPVASVNAAPVVVVASPKSSYSGFVNEINASGSYDTNNDSLSYEWIVPGDIAVSSTNDPKIQFLGPIVNKSQTVEFTLKVSNGKTTQLKTIPIEILPYKPELEVAEISNIEASSFQAPYYPYNIIDGNIGTMWSANGDNQWLIIELKQSFSVQHVKLAFQLGQREESYFDILGSEDKVNWEPILTKSASCAFSGGIQVFNFPPSKAGKEYKYIKLVGHSNSGDSWNYISEFKIFGYKHRKPSSYEEQPVKIYPNPAHDYINIRIDEPTLVTDFIRICNLSGKAVFQHEINPDIREYQFPINLHNGIYILQLLSHNLIQFTQKLVIAFK